MGLFSAIASIFGGGNSGGATDSKIAIRGDIAPIPEVMITPDYRPENGVYVPTSAQLVREWEGKKWMLTPEDLALLKTMHQTLQNYEKLSSEYSKELRKFSQTELKLVRHITKTIPVIAGSNFGQYAANQKMGSDMDKVAAEYQKNIASRQEESKQIKQNVANYIGKIQQRTKTLRGG